jgi:hypothetical protein
MFCLAGIASGILVSRRKEEEEEEEGEQEEEEEAARILKLQAIKSTLRANHQQVCPAQYRPSS